MPSKRQATEKEKETLNPAIVELLALIPKIEEMALQLNRIETTLAEIQAAQRLDLSPYVKGDKEAAMVAGFKSPATFRRWARRVGIRPEVRSKIHLWDRSRLLKGK